MVTLDEILNTTCAVMNLKSDKIRDKKRINEAYQNGRIVFSSIAASGKFGRYTLSEIGQYISRSKNSIWYYRCRTTKDTVIEREVTGKLKSRHE